MNAKWQLRCAGLCVCRMTIAAARRKGPHKQNRLDCVGGGGIAAARVDGRRSEAGEYNGRRHLVTR
jgi:hypothetical protein